MSGINVSFSHCGFVKMGIDDSSLVTTSVKDEDPFIAGQRKGAAALGDAQNKTLTGPDWAPEFNRDLDGLILISGESHASIFKEKVKIEEIFGVHTEHPSIHEIICIRGDVRPGDEDGHEHFGFLDGISNPTIIGFDKTDNPGPAPVNPGVIVTGYDGDADKDKRAPWAVDGSFLAFRYLFQNVPEFNEYLQKNPIIRDGLTPEEGSELLGARMVGRWKSGAPIDITPFKDDPSLGTDPSRNNDFDFSGDVNSQVRCPFAAHVRKTNPRHDLQADFSSKRMMRRGIQFGPEVTQKEREEGRTHHGRGLLFACYQTSIANGFAFVQTAWANEVKFPPKEQEPGLDPIIGQGYRAMSGLNPDHPEDVRQLPDFVVPRGGEYFFSPSLKALKETLATGA
ncbi:hypothetical protein BDQ17DRAFT_1353872 [Cyathus striatus]|nr:hypothetical protein BDQ17DRAFT_1353872 [Cyathus striatus]